MDTDGDTSEQDVLTQVHQGPTTTGFTGKSGWDQGGYDADSWSKVIVKPWNEITAESTSWFASNAASNDITPFSLIPLPVDLIVIDLPENDRVDALINSLDLLSPGGIIIVKEPEVPTGDVGEIKDDSETTQAQEKVLYFNKWIKSIRDFSINNSLSFVELTGGSLVILRKSE